MPEKCTEVRIDFLFFVLEILKEKVNMQIILLFFLFHSETVVIHLPGALEKLHFHPALLISHMLSLE